MYFFTVLFCVESCYVFVFFLSTISCANNNDVQSKILICWWLLG